MLSMYLKGSWRVTREKMSGSTTNPCTNSPDIGSLLTEFAITQIVKIFGKYKRKVRTMIKLMIFSQSTNQH